MQHLLATGEQGTMFMRWAAESVTMEPSVTAAYLLS